MTETFCIPSRPDPAWHGTANEVYTRLISATDRLSGHSSANLGEFTETLLTLVPELRRRFGTRPHAFTYLFRALETRDPDRIEKTVHVFVDMYVSEFSEQHFWHPAE